MIEKIFPPAEISSSRVILRKHQMDMAPLMFDYVNRDRERLARFLPWVEWVDSVAAEVEFIEKCERDWNEFVAFNYAMFRASDDQYLGNIGVFHLSWAHARCEIGYWILSDFEGQGYITDAVNSLCAAFFAMEFHRIEIRCDALNARSAKVPLRCGFLHEGTLREDAEVNGYRRDTMVFSKLKSMI